MSQKDVQTVPLNDIKRVYDVEGPQIQNPEVIVLEHPEKPHSFSQPVRFRQTNHPLL
jgi:hypothetical protein